MGAITSAAFPPPLTKPSTQINVICTIQRIDCRIYLDEVYFHNFKKTYSNLPQCKNNNVFR